MTDQVVFESQVQSDLTAILNRQYTTTRRGGHTQDADEYRRKRSFWPDMKFHSVSLVESENGGPQITIIFSATAEPGSRYGYRINVDRAVEEWGIRVGLSEPRKHPAMFAAELIWYMVTFIGVIEISDAPVGDDGVQWINHGDDVFVKLPGEHEH